MYQAKFTTAERVHQVTGWYEKALGTPGDDGIAFNPGTLPGIRISATDDSRQPGQTARALGEPRPLTLQVIVKKTNEFVVVAVVSRAQDERETHIAITFIDNKLQ